MRLCLLALLGLLVTTAPVAAQPRDQRIAQARQLLLEGVAAYERGELHIAVEKLLASQRAWRSPDTAFNIARCFERMGEAPRAIHWFRVYLRHGRPDATTRTDIEQRIADLRAFQERQRTQVFVAPPSTNEMTAEAQTFFARGVSMFQRGEYEAAMQAFTAAQHFAPFPELLYNMAITSERLERWRDAYDYYREYLRLRPNAPDRAGIERKIADLRQRR
jgi:tetratricopeptide (TPR) repeat protein